MKIVIDARIINSSTGRYVERLLDYLQEIDVKNEYIVLVPSKDLNFWTPKASNFTLKTCEYKNYSFGEQLGFLRYLNKLEADLVHFCMPQQPIFYNKPHVTTVHDMTLLKTYNSDKNWLIFHTKQMVGKFVFKRVGKTSVHVLAPSEFTKQEYAKFAGIPLNKVTVTYEAAGIKDTHAKQYKLPYKQFLLYVGQQSDYKNIKRLSQAHQLLLKKYPELGLVLVGSRNASAKQNEAWAKENDYKNILFTGFVSNEELAWLFKNCSAYVFPSLMEGFGLPGLEAMAYGAPVASSNATCLPEVYGEAAEYFNPLDIEDMANAIENILSSEELKTGLVKKGYLRVKKYSWKKMAQQTHEVYMSALRPKDKNI